MQTKITLIGREEETKKLDNLLASPQAELVTIYGRRRVGKTFLVKQYLKKHIVFHITGTQNGAKHQQLKNFFDEYITRSKIKKELPYPTNWYDAFNNLANYLATLQHLKTKQVVFIDEMPWLDTQKSGFIGALEFFWNQHGANFNNVLLVACGSASSWIKKKLINARGGLHNRVTQRIKLEPFNLYETTQFLKAKGVKLTQYQIVEVYMAMGGIPFYLNQIEPGKSSAAIIDDCCFSKKGLLYNEYEQLYHAIFKNAEQHVAIITALANQPHGITRKTIALKTKLSEGTLSRTLDELLDCDFIAIQTPYINKKKEAIYKLTDLYTLFYLKFIKPNKQMGKGTWKLLSQTNSYTAWSGYAFENICMLHTPQIRVALGIQSVYANIYSWTYSGTPEIAGVQIDILLDRADNTINLCEVKFTKDNFIISKSYAEKLKLKKSVFRQISETKKNLFTTLICVYPTLKNKYYNDEVENEITIDRLFEQNIM